jgi:hypothetical protein
MFPLFPLISLSLHDMCAHVCRCIYTGNSGNNGNRHTYLLLLYGLMLFPLWSVEWEQVGTGATVGQLRHDKCLSLNTLHLSPHAPQGQPEARAARLVLFPHAIALDNQTGKYAAASSACAVLYATNGRICLTLACSKAVHLNDTPIYLLDLQRSHKPSVYSLLRGSFPRPPAQAAALGNSVEFLWVEFLKCAVLTDCTASGCVVMTGVAHG